MVGLIDTIRHVSLSRVVAGARLLAPPFSQSHCPRRGRLTTLPSTPCPGRGWGAPVDVRSAAMTHEDAFLQDILTQPDDDTPRRIFADWLLDHHDPVLAARGELIHVQCDLAGLAPESPRRPVLVSREKQLLEVHGREWGSAFQRLGCQCWEYRRGFVEGVGMPASAFLAHAASLMRTSPVRELKLYVCEALPADLAECPLLARLHTLDMEKNDLGNTDLERLAASPYLGGLTTLLTWANRIGDL